MVNKHHYALRNDLGIKLCLLFISFKMKIRKDSPYEKKEKYTMNVFDPPPQ